MIFASTLSTVIFGFMQRKKESKKNLTFSLELTATTPLLLQFLQIFPMSAK